MVTIEWDDLVKHQDAGDSKEWLNGKIKADKERQMLEDLFGLPAEEKEE